MILGAGRGSTTPGLSLGGVLGAPNPCQKELTADGLCPSWFCFYSSHLDISHLCSSHLDLSHLDLSHLCSSHLCSSHLDSLCPLSTALSPFPVHHILSGPFLRKGKMPQVSRGSKSVFMSLQPFTARKNVFLSILGENNLVVDNCSHLSV